MVYCQTYQLTGCQQQTNRQNHSLVEFALAGIDNQLFVSKYLLELPKKEEMQRFIEEQLAAGDGDNADSQQTRGMESSDDEGGN